MKIQGFDTGVLWRALIYESTILLGAGCLVGAAFGVCSQILQSDALATTTGFPVVISAQVVVAFLSFAVVTAVAVALLALPGYRAASIRAYPYQ
jgi:putative ABC transport system permease protein